MTCKAFGGGEYTVNVIAPEKDVEMTRGKPKVYTYTGDSRKQFYCPSCTTHAYHGKALGDRCVLHPLLFDDERFKKLPIEMEIFGKDRMPFRPEIAKTYPTTGDS